MSNAILLDLHRWRCPSFVTPKIDAANAREPGYFPRGPKRSSVRNFASEPHTLARTALSLSVSLSVISDILGTVPKSPRVTRSTASCLAARHILPLAFPSPTRLPKDLPTLYPQERFSPR